MAMIYDYTMKDVDAVLKIVQGDSVTAFWVGRCRDEEPLDEADSVADIEGILVWRETDESLLLAVGSDQSVDLGSRDIVELLEGGLDLTLVGGTVDDEDKSVVLLDLLHSALSVEREEDGAVSIHARGVGNALSGVSRLAGQSKGLGSTEGGVGADLADLGARDTLEGGLLGSSSLDGLRLVGSFASSSFCGNHLDDMYGMRCGRRQSSNNRGGA